MEIESLQQNYGEDGESNMEEFEDDSEEDPTFDILEETRSGFSKLSLKKTKSRISNSKVLDSGSQEDEKPDDVEIKLPELDEKDLKSFENVEKLIAAGQLEKLKVDQCKVYMRKNGLRLMGTKVVLIERIREHLGIINGGGERKYPVSSFVLNCKGDACNGDVVMFEQNVYEMYNIASRSATGPPCGTRIVAGRVVKESYGSAKQQHTFTIEVLWSKGVKPLPPLHPLLIKGRNLYKLKTMRQLWVDEEKRRKVLLEKHSRGSLARSNRETRIQEKDMKMMHKGQRVTRKENRTDQEQKKRLQPDPSKHISSQLAVQPQEQQKASESTICRKQTPRFEQHKPAFPPSAVLTAICQQNNSQLQQNVIKPQNSSIVGPNTGFPQNSIRYQSSNVTEQHHNGIEEAENHRNNGFDFANNMQNHFSGKVYQSRDANANGSSFNYRPRSPTHGRGAVMQPRVCQYYPQGRCYFGENCRYLHEDTGKHVNDARIAAKNLYHNANESSCISPPWSPTRRSFNSPRCSPTRRSSNYPPWSPNRGRAPMQQQLCHYYAHGRCYHGETCKYLHERR